MAKAFARQGSFHHLYMFSCWKKQGRKISTRPLGIYRIDGLDGRQAPRMQNPIMGQYGCACSILLDGWCLQSSLKWQWLDQVNKQDYPSLLRIDSEEALSGGGSIYDFGVPSTEPSCETKSVRIIGHGLSLNMGGNMSNDQNRKNVGQREPNFPQNAEYSRTTPQNRGSALHQSLANCSPMHQEITITNRKRWCRKRGRSC